MDSALSGVPKLYIWLDRTLYLGTHYVKLRKYTVAADQLVVCLSGRVRIPDGEGGWRTCRTILLRAGTTVDMDEVDGTQAINAICYLNPVGQDYSALRQMMLEHEGESSADHRNEEQLIETLRKIRDERPESAEAYRRVQDLIFPPSVDHANLPQCDARVVRVIDLIKATVRENVPVSELAAAVHLSESRLVKLFRQEMGIPITRYRLRYRLLVGIVYLALGHSITEAALAAGFASTAHFSKCHTAMIGTPPSASFLKPPFLDISLSEDCRRAVAERLAASSDAALQASL